MNNTSTLWRIGADIPVKTRDFLLRRFPPAFPNVRCKVITLAYRVPSAFSYPGGPKSVTVYGRHRGEGHESLLIRVDGKTFRPDGTRFFIGLSLDHGVEAVTAAEIDSDSIEMLDDPIEIAPIEWRKFPLWNQGAQSRKAA